MRVEIEEVFLLTLLCKFFKNFTQFFEFHQTKFHLISQSSIASRTESKVKDTYNTSPSRTQQKEKENNSFARCPRFASCLCLSSGNIAAVSNWFLIRLSAAVTMQIIVVNLTLFFFSLSSLSHTQSITRESFSETWIVQQPVQSTSTQISFDHRMSIKMQTLTQ